MKKILTVSAIPESGNAGFWDKVSNEETQAILVYMMVNEIRGIPQNPGELSTEQALAKLSKLKSFVELLDFKEVFSTKEAEEKRRREQQEQEEIPDPLTSY